MYETECRLIAHMHATNCEIPLKWEANQGIIIATSYFTFGSIVALVRMSISYSNGIGHKVYTRVMHAYICSTVRM